MPPARTAPAAPARARGAGTVVRFAQAVAVAAAAVTVVPLALPGAATAGGSPRPVVPSPRRVVAAPVAPLSEIGGPRLAGLGLALAPRAGATLSPLPKITATAWVLADLDTGEVLAARGAHVRARPASTLKMLTALALLPRLRPTTIHIGTDADTRAEGSRAGIYPGGRYTVADLWRGLFLPSGNDCANALATDFGGVPATVAAMNATARQLQADDTVARNPSGLDADGELTSAYDLALIARAGLARHDFATLAATRRAQFPGKRGRTFQLWNQNRLLYRYPGAIGIKTGYTTLAKNTFAGAAQRGGHRLVVTLVHARAGTWKEAAGLLDWGFANRTKVDGVGVLVGPLSAQPPPSPRASTLGRPAAAPAAGRPAAPASRTLSAVAAAGAAVATIAVLGVLAHPTLRRRRQARRRRASWAR